DGLLALGKLPQVAARVLDGADALLVQPAGALLAVTGDERHRVALVEQLHHALHLHLADLQVLGDPRQVKPHAAPGFGARGSPNELIRHVSFGFVGFTPPRLPSQTGERRWISEVQLPATLARLGGGVKSALPGRRRKAT